MPTTFPQRTGLTFFRGENDLDESRDFMLRAEKQPHPPPLSARLRAGSQRLSWMDDWTSRGLVGAPLLLNMASTTAFIVALAPRGYQTMKCRALARFATARSAPSEAASSLYCWGRGISMERIPEMRVVPTFVESRQSDIDEKNNNILSCADCESPRTPWLLNMENHNIFIMALTPRSSPGKQKLFDRQGRGYALEYLPRCNLILLVSFAPGGYQTGRVPSDHIYGTDSGDASRTHLRRVSTIKC